MSCGERAIAGKAEERRWSYGRNCERVVGAEYRGRHSPLICAPAQVRRLERADERIFSVLFVTRDMDRRWGSPANMCSGWGMCFNAGEK